MSLLRSDAGAGGDMQPMRHLVVLVFVAAALAQAPPALAADSGGIEGRVINGTTGEPQRGVAVTLTSGGGERTSEETVTTGTDGRYRFDDLPTGENRFYVLDARYKDGLFAGRPLTLPADTEEPPVVETTLRVFEPTTDPNAILIRRDHLYLVHQQDRLSVVESIKVVNPTNNAYIGRGSALAPSDAAKDGPTPSLGFALPDGVIWESFRWREADLDVPEAVEIQGVGFGITSAVPPGELDFTFTYQVAGEGGTFDISRRALYEVTELSVFAAPPLEVESNRLEPRDELELEDTTYRRFTATRSLDSADPIQILVVAQAGSPLPLLAGAAAGLALLALIATLAFKRAGRRHRKTRDTTAARREARVPAGTAAPPTAERERLITEIAELDLRHRSGDVADEDYSRRRAELKQRLVGAGRDDRSG